MFKYPAHWKSPWHWPPWQKPANSTRWSQAIFEAVPGEAATIHVDPENPASAVLVPGDPTQEWLFFAAGIGGVAIMAFFGLAVILQGHRFRKKAA